jgi:uncharacterized damage-inducible protein DinB
MEMIGLAFAGIHGVAKGEWKSTDELDYQSGKSVPETKAALLDRWDKTTDYINTLWPAIPAGRFRESDKAFGQYEGPVYSIVLYWIDNENHHRGQGYVYLRSLGIEPPPFWDRE